MDTRFRYTPSAIFETFPFPAGFEPNRDYVPAAVKEAEDSTEEIKQHKANLDSLGQKLDEQRKKIMLRLIALNNTRHQQELENKGTILGKSDWDYDYNVFYPGFNGDINQHKYFRNCGTLNEAEPLVLIREFDGFADFVTEISEEFRLFHNSESKITLDDILSFHVRLFTRYLSYKSGCHECNLGLFWNKVLGV